MNPALAPLPLTPNLLLPAAKILILGSFGICLVLALRNDSELEVPFERLAIGFLILLFFQPALSSLWSLGQELMELVQKMAPQQSLKDFVLSSMIKAGTFYEPTTPKSWKDFGANTGHNFSSIIGNALSLANQAIRTGVWGVASSIVEFFFLLAYLVLESARDVLWQFLLIFFPLGAALYPIFPRILHNLITYAIEMTLWLPMLTLIDNVTSAVARLHSQRQGSLGLYVIAVEIIAIALILFTPKITHSVIHGALHADLGLSGSVSGTIRRVAGGGL
jgi:hypothetical protein